MPTSNKSKTAKQVAAAKKAADKKVREKLIFEIDTTPKRPVLMRAEYPVW